MIQNRREDGDQDHIVPELLQGSKQQYSQLSEAKNTEELQGQTQENPELAELKNVIARGYFKEEEKKLLGLSYDLLFTELAVVGELVVRRSR